jgi:hypothetical protein
MRKGNSPINFFLEFFTIIIHFNLLFIGFGLFYKQNGKIESINVDIISDNMGQKGISFINAFRFVILTVTSLTEKWDFF